MGGTNLERRIRTAGLKVTPQRITVLRLIRKGNHPTAEYLFEKVKEKYASISSGTIYHILDAFVERGVIKKVYTHGGVMRYDGIVKKHHHLHEEGTNRIEDYFDDELFRLIKEYFKNKPVNGFELTDIKIKLLGKFNNEIFKNEY
jgi:Fur family peroxide stress response transcriptional regulator